MAGQDTRRRVADRPAVPILHGLGMLSITSGGGSFFCAALTPLLLLFLCAFFRPVQGRHGAARLAHRPVLPSAVAHRQAACRSLYRIAVGLPLMWKTALLTLALVFIESILFAGSTYGQIAVPFLMIKLVELLAILYIALSLAHSAARRRSHGRRRLLPKHRHQAAHR